MVILKCPLDDMVLDQQDAETMTLFVKTGATLVIWSPCPSKGLKPHWVSAFFSGNTVAFDTSPLIAVTPSSSFLPDRGIAPAPVVPTRTPMRGVPSMVIRKRTISE